MLFLIKVKLLHPDAKKPFKAQPDDAGFDVSSIEELEIPPLSRAVVKTGLSFALPKSTQEGFGLYLRVAPRSGLAVKHGLDVLAGVVDASYRGELMIALFNSSNEPFKVEKGMRIAQLIPTFFLMDDLKIVDSLDETSRSDKGFGSSGLK